MNEFVRKYMTEHSARGVEEIFETLGTNEEDKFDSLGISFSNKEKVFLCVSLIEK